MPPCEWKFGVALESESLGLGRDLCLDVPFESSGEASGTL